MQNVIISDTSCFILLEKIGEIEILHLLFGTIITTHEIAGEFGYPLPHWVNLIDPINKQYQEIIEASLDKGEASAIALAMEYDDSLLIIDDLKGRKFAASLGIKITGTIGILIEAKLAGYIPSIKPILIKIRETNFRLSEELEKIILVKVGEQ